MSNLQANPEQLHSRFNLKVHKLSAPLLKSLQRSFLDYLFHGDFFLNHPLSSLLASKFLLHIEVIVILFLNFLELDDFRLGVG